MGSLLNSDPKGVSKLFNQMYPLINLISLVFRRVISSERGIRKYQFQLFSLDLSSLNNIIVEMQSRCCLAQYRRYDLTYDNIFKGNQLSLRP